MERAIWAATPADATAIARVQVESWRTTYRGIVPDEYLERMSVEPRERFWAGVISKAGGGEFVFVAESLDGEVIGFAADGPLAGTRPAMTSRCHGL